MEVNENLSYRDWNLGLLADIDLTLLEPSYFDGIIRGSNFSKPTPDTVVFPDGITSVFERCNLDNVIIPAGATIRGHGDIESTNKRMAIQNDKEYWILDGDDKPITPLNENIFDELGLSKDPNDIPAEMADRPITVTKEEELIALEG